MKRFIILCIVLVFVVAASAEKAQAPAPLASFRGAVGVIPTGSANTVTRGVTAAGQIWTIRKFAAVVTPDGHILAAGRGLLLAAGNGVGSNANQRVVASLFCTNEAGNVAHSSDVIGATPTAGVALDVNGDFVINATLSPAVPATCTGPALLIRSAASGAWFAAALPTPTEIDND
jgi:hypothetical protein